MANHPGDVNDSFSYHNERAADKTRLLPSVKNAPNMRAIGSSRCPNCGAPLPPGTSVCPECGEFLREKAKKIRCRRCGERASSSLVICPRCGRELMAAPSRLLTWGAPVILVALFLVAFVERGYPGNPITWLQNKVGAGATLIKKLGDNVAPSVNVSTEQTTQTPIALTINLEQKNNQAGAAVSQAITNTQPDAAPAATVLLTPTVASAAVITDTPTTTPTATPLPATATPVPPTATTPPTPTPLPTATSAAAAIPPTASPAKVAVLLVPTATAPESATNKQSEATATATGIPAKAQTSKLTPTATVKIAPPTNTATPLPPTATATATLAPTPTDTAVPQKTYVIQPGDTLNLIANRFGTDNQSIMAANGLTSEDIYRLRPGQTLVIPISNSTDNTNTKTGSQQTYTIQSGDTPIEIANTYGVSVAELLAANNLSADDARNLRVGQVLVIPGDEQNDNQPSPTPTTPTSATAAAPPPTATPASQSQYRLDAPRLRSPENGNSVSCGGSSAIVWQPVPFMLDNDHFVLHLGFVNGRNASGAETVTWVLEQVQPSNNTAWNMDTSLCALAPQNLGRQWRWYVEVIDANHNAVSPSSPVWGFSWN